MLRTVDPDQLYKSNDLDWLRRPDRDVEGPWIERKQSFDRDELGRQISAFGNAEPPGGLIIVGVTAQGHLVGLGDQKPKAHDGVAQISVDARRWTHRFVPVPGGPDEILFIRVPAATDRVVCRSDGKAFQRRGSSTIELRTEEIGELRYKRGENSFEDDPIVPFEEDVIDPAIARDLLKAMIEKNGITLEQTLEDALLNKRLAKREEDATRLTVAGYLAIGRRPTDLIPNARIHLQRFDGTAEKFGTQRNITKEIWFDGPTRQMLWDALEAVQTLLKDFDRLGPAGTFVHEPEYPRPAWEEAIVNAVVHRSYSIRNSPIEVRIFDDRFEVESPGGYPGPQRPNADGVFPLSYPRNPRFGEALRYLNLVRLAKEGTRRMSAEMAEMGLPPPKYEEIAGISVRVTLSNDLGRRRDRAAWLEIAKNLGEDLAIYRRQAYQAWSRLDPTASPPLDVLTKVERLLGLPDTEIPPGEKGQVLVFLERAPADATSRLVTNWARSLQLPFVAAWLTDGATQAIVSRLMARSDDAVELLLENLRLRNVPTTEGQRLAFAVLVERLRRPPSLPPKEWMLRALEACGKFPDISGELRSIIG